VEFLHLNYFQSSLTKSTLNRFLNLQEYCEGLTTFFLTLGTNIFRDPVMGVHFFFPLTPPESIFDNNYVFPTFVTININITSSFVFNNVSTEYQHNVSHRLTSHRINIFRDPVMDTHFFFPLTPPESIFKATMYFRHL